MRRIVSLVVVLLLCMSFACPALAATDTFVPSITYKDSPEVDDAELNNEKVETCVIVTSILGAENKSTDIYQESRNELLEVYKKLEDGSMKLPIEDGYVIRELVDISFSKTSCVEVTDHEHEEELAEEGVTITIDLDLGVPRNTKILAYSYNDGEWTALKSVTNNGDGTLTVEMEHFCPVAFCVKEGTGTILSQVMSPKTGDAFGQNLGMWIAVMVVSVAAVVTLVFLRRKKK